MRRPCDPTSGAPGQLKPSMTLGAVSTAQILPSEESCSGRTHVPSLTSKTREATHGISKATPLSQLQTEDRKGWDIGCVV